MSLPHFPALADDLTAAADRLRASTVAVLVGGDGGSHAGRGPRRGPPAFGGGGPLAGQGSGIVWRADGLVVTNAHVARSERLALVLPDGRRVAGRLVARDPRRDLALVQAEADGLVDGLVPAAVGDPAALRPGQLVLAFGHPLGLTNALAVGVVHGTAPGEAGGGEAQGTPAAHAAFGRRHHRNPWARAGASLIRADVRLLPGNSGGPLADASGRVVGVNTMVVGGLGVAVSVREVEALLAHGPLRRPDHAVPHAA